MLWGKLLADQLGEMSLKGAVWKKSRVGGSLTGAQEALVTLGYEEIAALLCSESSSKHHIPSGTDWTTHKGTYEGREKRQLWASGGSDLQTPKGQPCGRGVTWIMGNAKDENQNLSEVYRKARKGAMQWIKVDVWLWDYGYSAGVE